MRSSSTPPAVPLAVQIHPQIALGNGRPAVCWALGCEDWRISCTLSLTDVVQVRRSRWDKTCCGHQHVYHLILAQELQDFPGARRDQVRGEAKEDLAWLARVRFTGALFVVVAMAAPPPVHDLNIKEGAQRLS